MKRIPASTRIQGGIIVLGLIFCLHLWQLWHYGSQLPHRVASQFDGRGRPTGWMSREEFLGSALFVPLGMAMLAVFVCYAVRWLPDRWLWLPHKEHYLAPAERSQTMDFLFFSGLRLAALLACAMAMIVQATMQGNLDLSLLGQIRTAPLLSIFIFAVGVWLLRLLQHFKKPKEARVR